MTDSYCQTLYNISLFFYFFDPYFSFHLFFNKFLYIFLIILLDLLYFLFE